MVKGQKHTESTKNDTVYKNEEPTIQSQNTKENKAIPPEHPDIQNIKQLPRTGVLNIEVVNGVVVIKKETK